MVIKNQKGQAITEAVLMLVLFFGVTLFVSNYFVDKGLVSQIVKTPWQKLSGMIQNGEWETRSAGAAHHPSGYDRHLSLRGEDAK
jgi:hypothetical protein